MCELFKVAERYEELRHVLGAWYRLSNIVHSTKPRERFDREINRIIEIYGYSEYFPQRLVERLARQFSGTDKRADLTQFENLVLSAAKICRAACFEGSSARYYVVPRRATIDAELHLLAHHRLVEQGISDILTSTSWLITEPLVELRRKVKRLSARLADRKRAGR